MKIGESKSSSGRLILNDEIPNYYMVVGTVDYLINNKSGDLQQNTQRKAR